MKTYREKFSSDCWQYLGEEVPSLRLVCALSGGSDSIFLGELLAESCGVTHITVAHFDHCLRADSHKDAEFCRLWAAQKGMSFVTEAWQNPVLSEEKARNARYDFLERVRQETKSDAIVVGTHADDDAETIFFHFLRGSGLKGLSGITPFCPQRKLFRPLLLYTKAEICRHLLQRNIPFCSDETNAEDVFSRNFIRNTVFPLLESRFHGFQKRIIRQADVFRETEDYCEQQAIIFYKKQGKNCSRGDFFCLHGAIQSRVLQQYFAPVLLSYDHISSLREFVQVGISGKKMENGGKTLLLSHEYFFVT